MWTHLSQSLPIATVRWYLIHIHILHFHVVHVQVHSPTRVLTQAEPRHLEPPTEAVLPPVHICEREDRSSKSIIIVVPVPIPRLHNACRPIMIANNLSKEPHASQATTDCVRTYVVSMSCPQTNFSPKPSPHTGASPAPWRMLVVSTAGATFTSESRSAATCRSSCDE